MTVLTDAQREELGEISQDFAGTETTAMQHAQSSSRAGSSGFEMKSSPAYEDHM
jgi:hypothetical protein